MLTRVWQEACRSSRLQTAKAAMQRLDQAEMQPVKKLSRARPRAPSKSNHFVDARNSGSRARVLSAVDRQARSQLRCCLRRLWTNDRPRVLLDAGGAARAIKRLPRAARGDTRAAQLTDSPSALRTPAPSVDAVGVRGRCSTRVLPVKGCPTRWLRRQY